ncbi:MAG TPA: hypothetical protein VGK32_15385 [Vicinamibacterales bacterium]|jgi:hypothetical protein
MRSHAGLASDCFVVPPAGDGRPPLAAVLAGFDALESAGWRTIEIATQPAPSGGTLPVRAYANADEVDAVLIGGIHGREPAGALALARGVPTMIERGRALRLLVLPLLNPWGYLHHQRYGPSGQSVSDSDHLLGRAVVPACAEAAAITDFVMRGIRIRPGAAVLDLHEDPVYEASGYQFDGRGTYLYVTGPDGMVQPATRRVREFLAQSRLPLVREGVTRFGEGIVDGLIVDSADGSVDELLAVRIGCSPVLTVETVLRSPDSPPLAERVDLYVALIDAFFGASTGESLCARQS